jgi:hypothetical protein
MIYDQKPNQRKNNDLIVDHCLSSDIRLLIVEHCLSSDIRLLIVDHCLSSDIRLLIVDHRLSSIIYDQKSNQRTDYDLRSEV